MSVTRLPTVGSVPPGLLTAAAVVLAVGSVARADPAAQTVRTANGQFSLQLPAGWEPNSAQKTDGLIHCRSAEKLAYVDLHAEPKQDFDDISVKEYAAKCMALADRQSKLVGRQTTGPEEVKVGDRPAIRYVTTGSMNGLKLKFIHLFVQTPTQFEQVLCWSTPSRSDGAKTDFEFIAAHVQEVAHPSK